MKSSEASSTTDEPMRKPGLICLDSRTVFVPGRHARRQLHQTTRTSDCRIADCRHVVVPANHSHAAIGSFLNKLRFANLAMQRFDSQNVNVSSSAIKMTGGPPDEIFTALAKVCLPPADSAHSWSASMDGKCTSATR